MASPPAAPCLSEIELLDLVDGAAPPELRARAEAHLDGCRDCREQLAGFLRARAPSVSESHPGALAEPPTEVVLPRRKGSALPELSRGTALGRYVVLERIGAGGMGVVYAAYDPSLDRRIVLKLLRPSTQGDGSVEQRMWEAKAAARIQHPHVVAVHDVGTFGECVFIAMELMDGGTLRQHLAAAKPPWIEIVRLYLQAGRGLAAAHAAGVIHRDFKPDNVLVDRAGHVRVTDFGLARMAAMPGPDTESAGGKEEEPDPHSQDTQPMGTVIVGTPGYIAPEVLAGQSADPSSDQYSFCVSLYEGLYGTRPSPAGAPAPGARPSVPRTVHALVTRGLAAAREDRHPSMSMLLDALEQAVFPRTRRVAFAAAGAGLLAVLAVAVAALGRPAPCVDASSRLVGVWDAGRKEALLKAFTAAGVPASASLHKATSRALDTYAQSWVQAHRDACEATRVRGEQSETAMDLRMRCLERRRRELEALASVLLTADAPGVLRAPEAAQGLSSLDACADVEALAQPVPPPQTPEVAAHVEAAFARLEDARARLHAGRWGEAAEQAAAMVKEAEALGYKPLLGEVLFVEGRARLQLREEKAAALLFRRAALASLAGRDDKHASEALVNLVNVEGTLAERPEQAALWAEQARALLERVGGDPEIEATLLHIEGTSLVRRGKYAEAIPLLEKAREARERLYGPEHHRLADEAVSLGLAFRGLGRLTEALEQQRRAQAILERSLGPDHPYVAIALNNQGSMLAVLGRRDEALACFEKSAALFERVYGSGQQVGYLLTILGNIGALHAEAERYGEAARAIERTVQIARAQRPPGHPDRVQQTGNLATVLLEAGRTDDAVAWTEEMGKEVDAAIAAGRKGVINGVGRGQEAEILLRLGHLERATAKARQMVAMLREQEAPTELGEALALLSRVLLASGRVHEAQRAAEEAVSLFRNLPGTEHPDQPAVYAALGEVLLARGDAKGARTALERALADREKASATPLTLAATRFALARALRLSGGDAARARELATAAREALAPTPEPRRASLRDIDAFLQGK